MKKRLVWVAPIVAGIVFLDQLTKLWIIQKLPIGSFFSVIPGYFDIVHARNRGAAFGFLANVSESIRVPFFFIVSILALTLITYYFFKLDDPRRSVYVGLAMILGGALGNIADRIRLGEVVDFLSFHWKNNVADWHIGSKIIQFRWEWPAFNVADVSITCAVILLMLLMIKTPETRNIKD